MTENHNVLENYLINKRENIMDNVKENLNFVNTSIKKVCSEFDKKFDEIILVAVSKTVDLDRIKSAIDAGSKILGENKVQEAEQKFEDIKNYAENKNIEKIDWHLIGHLQKNKAKKAVKIFDLIHSIDSLELLKEVNRHAKDLGKIQNVLIQVNMSEEESKSGLEFEDVNNFFEEIFKSSENSENSDLYSSNIKIQGLMTIGPLSGDRKLINDCFKKTHDLFAEIAEKYSKISKLEMKYLSMGMSSDYDLAIKNGANILRIGSAIFGERNYN
jgi:hypothetical protein